MYTDDTTSTVSQENTKSTIKALLRNREQAISSKSVPSDSIADKGVLTKYSVAADSLDSLNSSRNLESESQSILEYLNSSNQQDNS